MSNQPDVGAAIPAIEMDQYFPTPRAEIHQSLAAADALIRRVVQPPRLLRPASVLVATGDCPGTLYTLRSGMMAWSRTLPDGREQIIMFRLPGDLLGLRNLIFDRYPDVLRAISPVVVQSLDHATALQLARSNPDIALRFIWQLAEDERRLHNWIVALGRGHAIQRIATLILDVRGRLMRAGLIGERRFGFPVTQQQIADHLGLTLVHVNRTLKRLRDENIVTFRRGVVVIDNLQALGEYAAPLQDIFERESPAFGGVE